MGTRMETRSAGAPRERGVCGMRKMKFYMQICTFLVLLASLAKIGEGIARCFLLGSGERSPPRPPGIDVSAVVKMSLSGKHTQTQ